MTATSSSYDPEIATKERYYAMLESEGMTDGDMVTFMDEKGYDWQIWTEIQHKEADGTFVSVSRAYENDKADAVSGTYAPEEEGTYRIVKTLYASTYGSLDYKFTAVSNEVTTGGETSGGGGGKRLCGQLLKRRKLFHRAARPIRPGRFCRMLSVWRNIIWKTAQTRKNLPGQLPI